MLLNWRSFLTFTRRQIKVLFCENSPVAPTLYSSASWCGRWVRHSASYSEPQNPSQARILIWASLNRPGATGYRPAAQRQEAQNLTHLCIESKKKKLWLCPRFVVINVNVGGGRTSDVCRSRTTGCSWSRHADPQSRSRTRSLLLLLRFCTFTGLDFYFWALKTLYFS